MRMVIEIELDNDAHQGDGGTIGNESARLLRKLADTIEGGYMHAQIRQTLKDINGNKTGVWAVFER